MTPKANHEPASPAAGAVPSLLIVAHGAKDPDGLFRELLARVDYQVRYAASPGAADEELKASSVALLIAAPEVSTGDVGQLLTSASRLRPGIPVLIIRNRQAEEPPAWSRRGVGLLRCPLLPEALSRSVDVVLGLAGATPSGERPRR